MYREFSLVALVALLGLMSNISGAQSYEDQGYDSMVDETYEDISQNSYDDYEYQESYAYEEDTYVENCSGTCESGSGGLLKNATSRRGWQVFGGADYLYVRANFSEALAFVEQNLFPPLGRTYHQLDFDYESSYRWFAGIRDCCCGGEILFSGTNLTSSANIQRDFRTNPNPIQTPFNTLDGPTFGPNGGLAGTAGGPNLDTIVSVSAQTEMDYWDITFSKTIPLGQLCDCCCDSCCDSCCGDSCCDDSCCGDGCCGDCCCRCCPAWDITWTGGVRIADGGWNRSAIADNRAIAPAVNSFVAREDLDFQGAGPTFGIKGRRYFGRSGMASVYLAGNISLLLGDLTYLRQQHQNLNASFVNNPITSVYDTANFTRIIPVTDIEVGGSIYLSQRIMLSAGYLFQAWHDLGMSPEVDVQAADDLRFDDANILGFDGLFARAEVSF